MKFLSNKQKKFLSMLRELAGGDVVLVDRALTAHWYNKPHPDIHKVIEFIERRSRKGTRRATAA